MLGGTRIRSRHLVAGLLALGLVAVGLPARAAPPAPAPAHDHSSHEHEAGAAEDHGAGADHHGDGGDGGLAAHGETEGVKLIAAQSETVGRDGLRCDGANARSYDVVAIAADITVNRFLDHDPEGRMYVLAEDLEEAREEVAANARARAGQGEPAVSPGLQGDVVEPLTLRVQAGECLRISLRNDLPAGEAASLHVHGSEMRVAGTDEAAIATNPKALARTGQTVRYEWMVRPDEQEGTHYFHSHGDTRRQTSHGLFGAVVVEPAGSTWSDPLTGEATGTGWAAVVQLPDGGAFREYAFYYHEIGHENYRLLDRADQLVPLVDPILTAYRPGARAMNYRSEPFLNRMALQQSEMGRFDESLAYSSYAFGDPATPVARAYLGDPVKQRVIHGGSEVFHVHHVHGGAIRWRRQPSAEEASTASGLDKRPPLLPEVSERVDSQSIGPSETFDMEDECGAGGCQQSAGDFLIHCHVAQHYFAGMWAIWRVYNTLQDGPGSTDGLPPLLPLPSRPDGVATAVSSDRLVGSTVDDYGGKTTIAAADLAGWVERQLPPRGLPKGYDASVLDWDRQGDTYLNQPEAEREWPGYRPRAPGGRPPLLFDPRTGKLAYPFLRPHLGQRPPFAPNHGPSPFLDPSSSGTDPPAPGANGPASVCPAGTRVKQFGINALPIPVPLNKKANLVDPSGELFVLSQEEEAVRADDDMRRPLAIRANAGEDCIDIVLRSQLEDSPGNRGFAKVNLHIHFMQFDVQASDGVITGFNYEQSVRPYTVEGEKLTAPVAAGAPSVALTGAERFQAGAVVGVGMEEDATFEVRRIAEVRGSTLVFDQPLAHPHAAGRTVSTEFVRYRWYPDVQFGTAYFHDHVNALTSWRHGLYGAVIVEPPGSTYHDPRTGAEVPSGPLADIRAPADAKVTADVSGSFREAVMFIQDDNPLTALGRSTGNVVNLRAEPVEDGAVDPFSSSARGDPETPVIEAYLGDPVVMRTTVGGTNEVHTLHVDGHWFRAEPFSTSSPPMNTVHLGISERYDLAIPRAGGPQRLPGDYLYYSGRSFKLQEGHWGLLRVHDGRAGEGLQRLPGRETAPEPAPSVCPPGAPDRRYAVSAVDVPLQMIERGPGKIFVLDRDRAAVLAGSKPPEPLVLHVGVGDCITVDLTNATVGTPVSMHADLLAYDPATSAGMAAGREPSQSVAPGATRTYQFFASPEVGQTTGLLRDWGDVLHNPGLGLYGAVVVGPPGARYLDPATGADVSDGSDWDVVVQPPDGPAYRDFSLFLQDEDPGIGTHRMPYSEAVGGTVGINYRAEPLGARLGTDPDPSRAYDSSVHGEPATPLLEANVGDPVAIHVLSPWSEQNQVFTVEGHQWPFEPGLEGTDRLSSVQLGGLEAPTLLLEGGAGGREGLPGDYLYGNHREPFREAGQWGLFRVSCPGKTPLLPLPGGASPSSPACGGRGPGQGATGWAAGIGTALALAGMVAGGALLRRRQRRPAVPAPAPAP